jgi:amino acid adenylation domain-containing protein/non-ribosomal peptide synthase protein (TIGR01720 family)
MTGPFLRPATLAAALWERARVQPERVALRFVDAQGDHPLCYRALHERALALSLQIRERAAVGDRVMLLQQSGLDYVASFFACLYAGVIAVPAYPPESVRKQHLRRLVSVAADAQPSLVLTTSELARTLTAAMREQAVAWPESVAIDEIALAGSVTADPLLGLERDAIAFLQYTSGSTSTPKGVQVTHGNLEANEWAIRCAYGIHDQDVIVSWLPLFHDMGLIGGLLQGIYSGVPVVLMQPQYFVGRPLRWLDAISRFGGTVSGGPDFAYRLCRDLISQNRLSDLDLSTWRLAFSGAEPIREDSLRSFADKFAVCGFRSQSFLPSYGLAEATLFVAGAAPGCGASALQVDAAALAGHRIVSGSDTSYVSCGKAPAGHALRIVDTDSGAELSDDRVGEIWFSGPSVAQGYWQRPRESAETFVAQAGRRWLRTGDLGFVHDGELFITGRHKDMLIIRGQNLYPQDIERTIEEEIEDVSAGRVAVFPLGDDGFGVAAEISRRTSQRVPLDALMQRIRSVVAEAHHELPSTVALLHPGSLPKTSSGKLQRSACRVQLEQGALVSFAISQAAALAPRGDATASRVAALWCQHLGVASAAPDDNFFEAGGNSIRALQLLAALRDELGIELEPGELYREPRLRTLLAHGKPVLAAPPRERPLLLPQSVAQERLWLQWQLNPYSVAYNIPTGLRLRGELDEAALQRSLDQLIARHESLRTTFYEQDGRGFQRVHPARAAELRRVDLCGQAEARAQQLWEQEAYEPFDLERGPLLRLTLAALSDEEHWLLLTVHHSVADGWSLNLLLQELAQLYAGDVASLPELRMQCADFAVWERAQPIAARATPPDAGEPLALPLDRPHDLGPSPAERVSLPLDAALAQRLQAAAQAQGTSLFVLLLAAFQALLHRYSGGQRSIRLGVPFAGRAHRDVLQTVGCFVQTRVLQVELDGRLSFEALCARAHAAAVQAQADLALDAPVFEVMFNHQQRDASALRRLPGLLASELSWHSREAKVDLQLHSEQDEKGRIRLSFDYASGVFERTTIERLAQQYVRIVSAVSETPTLTLDALELHDADELARLAAWSCGPVSDGTSSLPELLEQQLARAPRAPALNALDYRSLHARANRLALRLRALGVGPEVRVALMFERSTELLVVLLAIVKAGGAYVPLDPDYPLARLDFMLRDSGARILLGQERLLSLLNVPSGVTTLALERAELEREAAALELPPPHPEQLAYVIYTSGSTGQPKGVGISYGALSQRLQWMKREYAFDSDDVFLQKAPLSFDVSVWECFLPLICGSSVVLAAPGEHRDPRRVIELVQEHGVTVLHFVPSLLQWFVNEPALSGCTSVRYLFSGGEVLPAELCRRVQKRLPSAQLSNRYGPSEATINATHYRCTQEPRGSVPIGRPLADSTCEIRDDGHALAAIGGRGELHLGGSGLARGYLGRPGLTAERFIPADGGARMYRSGDLARWNSEGTIEFVGRADEQIKLRGSRLELSEVRAQLLAQQALRDAAVLVHEGHHGPQLVAYIVADSSESDAELSARLRAGFAQRLPDFMHPAHYVRLPALPLTPSGKLDRRALPDPVLTPRAYAAPRGDDEQIIAGIWQTVLGQDRVGRDDDFFELGGHSLLATQIVSRTRQAFGIELTLRDLLDASRMSLFAERVAARKAAGQGDRYGVITQVDRSARLALSYSQQRMWVLWQLDPTSPAYNVGGVVRMSGALDVAALEYALDALIARHETLRTSFPSEDGVPYQRVSAHSQVRLERSQVTAAGLQLWADEQAHQPFDLAAGPLLRVCLARVHAREHHLLVTVHHIVAEGWAMNVFARELTELYEARVAARAPSLPPLPLQYLDYSAWQRSWLEAGELQRQLDYWTTQLGGEQPVLELPTDRPRPAVQSHCGDLHRFEVDATTSRALRLFNMEHGVTSFMTATAALAVLLYRYAGQSDLRIGTPVANRVRPESEHLIGAFLNTQVLRLRPEGGLRVSELLRQVREAVIDGQSNQELPFDHLVEALRPQRSAAFHPLFQVMCNVQRWDFQQTHALADGLSIEYRANDARATKFDLYLEVTDIDQRLRCCLTYSTDLFERERIERMARHWQNVLQAMIAAPAARLCELPLLDVEERRMLLAAHSGSDDAPFESAHALFEARVAAQPEAAALSFEGTTLSYAELNRRANQLAHRLIELGVGPEVRVGLSLRRSPELVIGLLAVLKAGGAYVPLDPEYPEERLRYMIEDAGLALVLTAEALGDVATQRTDNPKLPLAAEHLAYMIYTSGSTGRPKGVAVAHGPLAMHCRATAARFGMRASDCELHFYSINFDAATERLLVPLISGAQLVLRAQGQWEPSEVCALIERHNVSVLGFTPSYGSQLAQWLKTRAQQLPVRLCIVGGEALTPEYVHSIREAFAPEDFWNAYGPTETVVMPLAQRVPDALDPDATSVPIGRVVGARRLYVLDADLALLPAGAAGELYVGGYGLARGYHARAGLTAERFVPDPFDAEGGGRLYRTGDRVRQRRDGSLEFLGRSDQQVKIRGFRIELGEIEALLQTHAEVAEAAVSVIEQPSRQLVGYVVPARAAEGLAERLQAHLLAGLPEYMVPAHILVLERFPLNANGKLDRAALPLPVHTPTDGSQGLPRSETERVLVAIWRDVLGVPALGVDDNFFELGGDSILSIQVVSRARQAGMVLSAKDLFRYQTIRSLAASVRVAAAAPQHTGPVMGSTPLTPIQHWFFEQQLARPSHWNQAVLLASTERLDPERLRRALQAVYTQHDALRLVFSPAARTAEYRAPEPCELLWTCDEDARLARFEDAQRSLDIARGPLLRAVLVEGAPQRLLLVIHHLAVDGVSWRVLLSDLQAAYRNAEAALPARTSSLRDWATRLSADVAELGFWQAQLTSRSQLPCDDPHGQSIERHAARLTLTLDPQRTQQLLRAAGQAYRARVDELLLVALTRTLAHEGSLLVQVEGHGREELFADIDLSRTVGWFTSAYPVRLTASDSLAVSIKQIKEQLRAVPNKGIGYGALRYLGDAETRAAMQALPHAAVGFNYLGQFDADFGADALFRPLDEPAGSPHDAAAPLPQLLTLDSQVYAGELRMRWTFSDRVFRMQTVADIAERFRRELAALIEHCLGSDAGAVTPSDFPLAGLTQAQLDALPIPFAQIEDVYPLTPMQEGMLLHSLLDPGTGMYFMQDRYSIDSELDMERFDRAWRAVIVRHEALRASFSWNASDTMLQIIQRGGTAGVEYLDWSSEPEASQERRLQRLLEEERAAGFDLLHEPPLRLRLIRLAPARHWFIMSNHHILIDAWCRSILMSDFFEIYHALGAGTAPKLAAPPRYRDFIAWLRAQGLSDSKAWWQGALAGFDQASELPSDRPIVQDKGGMRVADRYAQLSAAASTRLRELAQRHQLTVNTFAQAAWALVLQRYNAGRELLFGVTVAGRPASLPETQRTVGLFINTIPLRVPLPAPGERAAVSDWLQRLLAYNLELREHEHVPLVAIQELSELAKGRPLFDSLLVFENAPVESSVLDRARGLNARSGSGRTHTNYPLTVVFYPGESLGLHLSYDQRFFDDTTIERLLSELERLLLALLDGFHGPLAELPLLAADELRGLVEAGNDTARDYPLEQGYVPLFEAEVRAHPARVVARCEGEAWTYADLDLRANYLGHELIHQGALPDQAVALLAERGLPLLGMMVGTFKAGAAYVPLDPAHPEQRMLEILRSSGARVLVCSEGCRSTAQRLLEQLPECRLLVWEAERTAAHAPGVAMSGRHLAYVLYTSGSTGAPKGVAIEQAGMLNNQLSKRPYLQLSPRDVIAQTASQCFDISVWQFLAAPLFGACVEIVPDLIAQDPGALCRHVAASGITVLECVPALVQGMLTEGAVGSLRCLLLTGEATSPELARRVLQRYPGVQLVNAYGPAECSDDVALFDIDVEATRGAHLPIGTATDNNRLYLLDAALQPVPLGTAAELFVAGTGVGRGYAGDPVRTALSFLPDPYAEDGGRLYRSGDLARRDARGVYAYLGRLDHQVKLRGFRIELGEIEARLHERPELAEAAVAVQKGPAGSYLVGYVVPAHAEPEGLAERLRAALRAQLPEYMVPMHWQLMAALPRNANGKLDRNALPALDIGRTSSRYVAPRSELERSLAGIWADVLELERVGVTDDFFELGGHSLLATQIAARVQKTMMRGVPLRAMFECSTVEALARYIEAETTAALTEHTASRISDLMSRLEQRD